MPIAEAFQLALQSIWANKMRSILTLLGVVIAIASVITVVTLTSGARLFVTSKINSYGASIATISKMPQTFMTMTEYADYQKRREISLEDLRSVKEQCKTCVAVGAQRMTTGRIVYGKQSSKDAQIRGWSWTMPPIANQNLTLGRSFTEAEDERSAQVAIVGADVVENLLGPGDPLGKEIRIDGAPYKVIGVGEAQGKMFGASMDNWAAIPLTRFTSAYGANVPSADPHSGLHIYVDAGGGGEVLETALGELRSILRARRHLAPGAPDTFNIDSSATFQNLLGKILSSFGAVVASIAAISLVVGGIVIMNIMLVSVTERTREIGVRKALGARPRDLRLQFLIESATLSAAGGLLGILIGLVAAKAISIAIDFPAPFSLWSILAALLVASAVGLFFGIYPAHKAAALDPIEALRAEL